MGITTSNLSGSGNLQVSGSTNFLGNEASDVVTVTAQLTGSQGAYFNNRVGIGTASPSNQLEIEGSSGDLIFEIDNNASNSANFQIQNGAGNARVDLVMNDGSANTTITMKGQKVGIGDTSPSYSLDVTGDGQFTTDLRVGDDLLLTSDSAVLSLGAGTDFTITHDGTTGATLAGNPVNITGGGASTWKTTAGAITIDAEASTLSLDGHTGVTLVSSNSGEVDITSAANVDINATTTVTVDGTGISIDGTDDSNLTVAGSNKDLTLSVSGGSTQTLTISSAGTGTNAIDINATAGGVDIDANGAISLDSAAGSIDINVVDGQTVNVGLNGAVETIWSPHGTAGSELWSTINTAGTTDGSDAAGSILLSAVAGGIGLAWADDKDLWAEGGQFIVTANHDTADAIKLHADAGSSQTIQIVNDAGTTDGSDDAGAIELSAAAGGIGLAWADGKDLWAEGGRAIITANEDAADCIKLHADAGSSQTITIVNDAGTNAAAIGLTATAGGVDINASGAISLDSTAGSIDINVVDGQTVNVGLNGAVETIWSPHGTAGSELWSTINTAGTTDGSDAAGAILLSAVAGGIGLAWADDKDLWAEGGQFVVTANHNTAGAIKLHADAGSSQTILIVNDEGTGSGAITLTATAGGITLNSDSVTLGEGGDTDIVLTFNANTADGVLTWLEDEDVFEFSDKVNIGPINAAGVSASTNGLAIKQDTADKQALAVYQTVKPAAGYPQVLIYNSAGSNTDPHLRITNAHDSNTPAIMDLVNDRASEADDDVLGTIRFSGNNSNNDKHIYATISGSASDITDADEGGKLTFEVYAGGSGASVATNLFSIGGKDQANSTPCEVIVNDAGIDCDFRVEGDVETHLFFVDAGNERISIGDSVDAPAATLEITNHASAGATGVPLLQLNSNDTDKTALDINAANINADVIDIAADAVTTANVLDVTADALTTGKIFNLVSNSSTTSARELVKIHNDHASATNTTCLYVRQDARQNGGEDENLGAAVVVETAVGTADQPLLKLMNSAADTNGAIMAFVNEAEGAAGDDFDLGTINFIGLDSGDDEVTFAQILAESSDVTNNDEGGKMTFSVFAGGTAGTAASANLFSIGGEDVANGTVCEVVVNDASVDCDFRVETDSNANAFLVDAGNDRIVLGSPLLINDNGGDVASGAAVPLTAHASLFVTAAGETSTLAAGTEGQIKVLVMKTDGGDMVTTVTNAGWKSSGTGTVTFDTIGDSVTLQYIDSKWYCIGNNGGAFA
jgi:hypothetical protein